MTRHEEPHGRAVVRLQPLAVHPQGDDRFGMQRLCEGEAAGKIHGVAMLLAVIGALEDHFGRAGGEAGRFEQGAERHAAPLGVADRAGAPLHALGAFAEKRTPVAGAFDGREHGVLGQRGQLGERPGGGPGDQAVQRAGPRGGVSGDGRLKVVAHEKESVRGDPAGGVVEGRFAVLRGRRDDFSLGIHRRDVAEPRR